MSRRGLTENEFLQLLDRMRKADPTLEPRIMEIAEGLESWARTPRPPLGAHPTRSASADWYCKSPGHYAHEDVYRCAGCMHPHGSVAYLASGFEPVPEISFLLFDPGDLNPVCELCAKPVPLGGDQ